MSRRHPLREGEVPVISVTPVSRGVLRPFLVTVTTMALIVVGASRYQLVHRFEEWLMLILVVPIALVTLTRTWRWRSHKVHVTNARVITEGGVLRHQRTSIELRDVVATRVVQRLGERLTRRGVVYVETALGPVSLGFVRHPGALCRLIDAERAGTQSPSLPLDTVFTYEERGPFDLQVQPDEWQRRRHD
jgi:uncharacterized membrane protein YdbT with pleckstrin-like domain